MAREMVQHLGTGAAAEEPNSFPSTVAYNL